MRVTEQTDWERYHRRANPAALLTRSITGRRLLETVRRHLPSAPSGPLVVVELGGGSSSFYPLLSKHLKPARYHLVDTSLAGLASVGQGCRPDPRAMCHVCDVRHCRLGIKAQVVFSVGLIEHFNAQDLTKVLDTHFALAAPGGLVVITFPTPTWLYRLARGLAEFLGLWHFPDERPLTLEQARDALAGRGEILAQAIIWPIVFTQGLLAVRAPAPPEERS